MWYRHLLIPAGIILIALALQDTFQTLFHPASHGTLSDWLSRFVWTLFRRVSKPRGMLLTLAGPFAMLLIIMSWTVLIVFGCALIYYREIDSFRMLAGLQPVQTSKFFNAWNTSMGSLITITGDMVTLSRWVRFLMNFEAVIGVGLVTASVSWLLSVYPVLESKRTLACFASSLDSAGYATKVDVVDLAEGDARAILMELSSALALVRIQTAQFPITYFFSTRHKESELAVVLPFMDGLAIRACDQSRPSGVRLAGAVLNEQVDSYLHLVAQNFLRIEPDSSHESLMRAYIEDHRQH